MDRICAVVYHYRALSTALLNPFRCWSSSSSLLWTGDRSHLPHWCCLWLYTKQTIRLPLPYGHVWRLTCRGCWCPLQCKTWVHLWHFLKFLYTFQGLMFNKWYRMVVNVKTAVHKVGQAIKNMYNLYISPLYLLPEPKRLLRKYM